MWVFIFQKYGKFGSILLGHFIKYKPLISEEWHVMSITFYKMSLYSYFGRLQILLYYSNVKKFFTILNELIFKRNMILVGNGFASLHFHLLLHMYYKCNSNCKCNALQIVSRAKQHSPHSVSRSQCRTGTDWACFLASQPDQAGKKMLKIKDFPKDFTWNHDKEITFTKYMPQLKTHQISSSMKKWSPILWQWKVTFQKTYQTIFKNVWNVKIHLNFQNITSYTVFKSTKYKWIHINE